MCGLPIHHYHHIVPWSEEQHFRVEDMMVLCPIHHDQATKKALTEEEQRAGKRDPFNLRRGSVDGSLKVNQKHLAVEAGGVLMVADGPLIKVDDEPLLETRIVDGVLAITARLYDEDARLLASIEENEWTSGDPLPSDIESDHRKLTLRSKSHDIRLQLNAQATPVLLRGKLWHNGAQIRLRSSGIQINEHKAEGGGGIYELGLVELGLNLVTETGTLEMGPLHEGESGMTVSEPDPVRRVAMALNARARLRGGSLAIEKPRD